MFSEFMPIATPGILLAWDLGSKAPQDLLSPHGWSSSQFCHWTDDKQQELLLPVGCSRGHSLDLPVWCFLCWRELLFISPIIPSGPRMVSQRVHWVDNLAFEVRLFSWMLFHIAGFTFSHQICISVMLTVLKEWPRKENRMVSVLVLSQKSKIKIHLKH